MRNNNHKTVRLEKLLDLGGNIEAVGVQTSVEDILHSSNGHDKKFAFAPSFGEK